MDKKHIEEYNEDYRRNNLRIALQAEAHAKHEPCDYSPLYRFGESSSEYYGNAFSKDYYDAQRMQNQFYSNIVLKMTDPKAYAIKVIRKQPYF